MITPRKIEIINTIVNLLVELLDDEQTAIISPAKKPVEMITIKECTEIIQGLSEHTVRKLVAQDKIKHIRTGEGKRGKILVNKDDLISYFEDKS